MKVQHRPVTRSLTHGTKPKSENNFPRPRRKSEGGLKRGKRAFHVKVNAVQTYFLIGRNLEETARQVGIHKHTLAIWIRQLVKELDLHEADENYSAAQDYS